MKAINNYVDYEYRKSRCELSSEMRYKFINRKDENGFTLIEVVAGLIILAIGFLAIATMQITSTKGGYFSSNVTQATIFAQDKLEYLKNLSYSDSNLSSGQHNEGTILGTIFSRRYDVLEDEGNSLKTITVTVNWIDRMDHNISFSTIRSK
jgi:prepilin-type N-terminal cleavage/methylation domain-containing protein